MSRCLLHRAGARRGHRPRPAGPAPLLQARAPSREDVVVWVAGMFPCTGGPPAARATAGLLSLDRRSPCTPSRAAQPPTTRARRSTWPCCGAAGGCPRRGLARREAGHAGAAPAPSDPPTRGAAGPSPTDHPAVPPPRARAAERRHRPPRWRRGAVACSRRAAAGGRRSRPAGRRGPPAPRGRRAQPADGATARRPARVPSPGRPRPRPHVACGPALCAACSHALPTGPGGCGRWPPGPMGPGRRGAAVGPRRPAERPGVAPVGLRRRGAPGPAPPSCGPNVAGPRRAHPRPGAGGDGLGSAAGPGRLGPAPTRSGVREATVPHGCAGAHGVRDRAGAHRFVSPAPVACAGPAAPALARWRAWLPVPVGGPAPAPGPHWHPHGVAPPLGIGREEGTEQWRGRRASPPGCSARALALGTAPPDGCGAATGWLACAQQGSQHTVPEDDDVRPNTAANTWENPL
jgi:hypothetical protein